MPKNKPAVSGIGLPDLTYAVNRLISLGKTSAREVSLLAGERPNRIAQLEKELAVLRSGAVSIAPRASKTNGAKAAPKARKRRFTMTPKALRARKLQGRYLGLLRKLDAKQRAQAAKAAKEGGVAAAVKVAEKLARS